MRPNPVLLLLVVLVSLGIAYTVAAAAVEIAPPDRAAEIERGRYLVTGFGCADCHSPWIVGARGPEPDPARYLAGHPAEMQLPPAPEPTGPWLVSAAATNTAWAGPWGVSFTANLTPDEETGLGRWTAEDFIAALRNGRHQGRGRELLPPMPFAAIRTLSDVDLRAMFAYLRSIPALENRVPEPLPPATR